MLADASILGFNLTIPLQVAIFLITAYLLWRYAWKYIIAVLTARQERIDAGQRAADEAERRLREVQTEVEQMLEETRARGRDVLSRAHQDAAAEAEDVRRRGRRDAEAQVERARMDIEAERERALQELRAQISSLVVAAASQVLRKTIDEQAHRRLIEESLHDVAARE